ncbi:MAG TPA: ATP-binding protein [Polyangia bacterium]
MNLAVAVCGNFEPEVRLLLQEPDFSGVDAVGLRALPPDCGRPALTADALRGACAGLTGDVEVFGGACCAGLPETCGNCTVHRLSQCFYLVAPAALVDHYLAAGAYLVTPGWLAHWRARLARLGVDAATAPAIFGESLKRVVLLDTGAVPESADELREFAAVVGLPAERVPVGLEHLRLQLAGLVARRRIEAERAETLTALGRAHRGAADYAAAFDLLTSLTEIAEEPQAIQRALDVFCMLFAPRQVTFVSVVDGAPTGVVSRPPREVDAGALLARVRHEGDGRIVDPNGFLLPIKHLDEVLGLVAVEGIAAPDHLDRALGLALTIAGVCGLAVSNARKYEKVKRAEEALATERERLAVTLHSIADAAVATDLGGTIVLLNGAAEALIGAPQGDILGRPLAEVVHVIEEQSRAPITDPGRAALAAGRVVELPRDAALLRRDGTVCAVSGSAAPLRGRDGRPLGVVLTLSDVSVRKRAEESMRASEARLRLLSHTAGRLLGTEDPQAVVSELCREVMGHLACQVFFNYLVDDAAGRLHLSSWAGIPDEEARKLEWLAFGEAVCGCVARDRRRIVAEDLANSTGPPTSLVKSYALQAYACHPLLAQGRLLGTLSFGTRTRARFAAEELALMQTVADQVATAMDRMQGQRALRVANARLVDADRRKDEFLAMLSHELRNPLAPIRNSVYILERAAPGGEQATRARQVIDRQAQHMTRLIDDLLDVTRMSRDKIRLQRERVELNRVVRGTGEDLRESFRRNGIDLCVRVTGELLFVDGDPTRIAQMIGNLLQNAAKFTPRGGHTSLTLERGGDEQAVVQVRDDGAGIQRELLAALFEPFVQADRTLDRSRGGLGLGLALVKGLAELHGGSVSAESDGPGAGAQFTIRLPLETHATTRAAVAAASGPARRARRVLIIEDNLDAAQTLKEALEMSGHAVEVAHAGREGIEQARAFHPDLILCDIGLPGMDGHAVATAVRSDAALGAVFLVALTGYAGPDDADRARAAGFNLHLAKPPDLAALEKVIADLPAPAPAG